MSILQSSPVHPAKHSHRKLIPRSIHVPFPQLTNSHIETLGEGVGVGVIMTLDASERVDIRIDSELEAIEVRIGVIELDPTEF